MVAEAGEMSDAASAAIKSAYRIVLPVPNLCASYAFYAVLTDLSFARSKYPSRCRLFNCGWHSIAPDLPRANLVNRFQQPFGFGCDWLPSKWTSERYSRRNR